MKVSLPRIDKKQAIEIASDIIYYRLGSTLGAGTPELGETIIENKVIPIWIVPIRADHPRYLEDYSTKLTEHVILHLGKLAEIEIDAQTGEDLTIPNRHTINGSFSDRLDSVRRNVEKILIRTASKRFAKLINVRYMLTPVNSIITNLLSKKKLKLEELININYQKYIDLLQRSDFLVIGDGIISPSPNLSELFVRFLEKSDNKSTAITETLERVT